MYFIDDRHKENYESLLLQYPGFTNDVEYLPTIYITAFPEVFKFIDTNKIEGTEVAFKQLIYFEPNEEGTESELKFVEDGLTSGSRSLIRFGMSCFSGFKISLEECSRNIGTETWREVMLQTFKIRMSLI